MPTFTNTYELLQWAGKTMGRGESRSVLYNGKEMRLRMTEKGTLTYFNGREYAKI